jgi:hypothetical protein
VLKRVATVTALAGSVVLGLAGVANACPPSTAYHAPEVAWVHHVDAGPDSATLLAKYRCWGGNEGTHLWVSLKQGGGIKGDPNALAQQEGTSTLADAWYDSHPEGVVVCNAKWQVQEFTVNRELANPKNTAHPGDWNSLKKGHAFLQFCLFDSTGNPMGADPTKGFGYLYQYVGVHTQHHDY